MRFLFNDEMYDPVNITSNFGRNFPRLRFLVAAFISIFVVFTLIF